MLWEIKTEHTWLLQVAANSANEELHFGQKDCRGIDNSICDILIGISDDGSRRYLRDLNGAFNNALAVYHPSDIYLVKVLISWNLLCSKYIVILHWVNQQSTILNNIFHLTFLWKNPAQSNDIDITDEISGIWWFLKTATKEP